MIKSRRILLENLHNLRDLGGIPISLNRSTKYKVFLRSDALTNVTKKERDFLYKYGVRNVIDLRSTHEVLKHKSPIEGDLRFKYFSIPLLDRHIGKVKDDNLNMNKMYINIVDEYKEEIKNILSLLINFKGASLYYCAAGKDRTGIISAIILLVNHVNILDVLADYEISSTYLTKRTEHLKNLYPDINMHLMESKKESLLFIIEYINNKYGSLNNYLLSIGLTNKDILKLANKL